MVKKYNLIEKNYQKKKKKTFEKYKLFLFFFSKYFFHGIHTTRETNINK